VWPGDGGIARHLHLRSRRVARAAVGQVEARLRTAVTGAQLWLAQAPPQTEQLVWHVVVIAAVAAMQPGRRFAAAEVKGRVGCTEPGLVAWAELAERGARRAVADFGGRLQGLGQ
jgi:hypothetical protein